MEALQSLIKVFMKVNRSLICSSWLNKIESSYLNKEASKSIYQWFLGMWVGGLSVGASQVAVNILAPHIVLTMLWIEQFWEVSCLCLLWITFAKSLEPDQTPRL